MTDDQAGFTTWKTSYRPKFFERYPFVVPATVPQTNNVQNPAQGTPVYEADVPAFGGPAEATNLPSGFVNSIPRTFS